MSKNRSLACVLSYLCLSIVLGGCAAPAYVLPEGAAAARLSNRISAPGRLAAAIDIWRVAGCGIPRQQQLFKLDSAGATPASAIEMEANEPQTLVYFSSGYGGYCKVVIEATFEPGKSYSLVGGPAPASSPLSALIGRRQCVFGVHNDTDGVPLPVTKRCGL
jgi:hypothetical protein